MSVLSLRGVGKRFDTAEALRDITLDVAEGARLAVVGPSGSGKTTLLRLIAGFETPDGGEIRLNGNLIADAKSTVPPHRRNIGLMMQEGALFPHLDVLDNIRFGIAGERESAARARELLAMVELEPETATRAPHQLSGGQQQRVALARALARRPRLLLLDEPFSSLDSGLRGQMRAATARILGEAGLTTVLVTHDREEAMDFADQLALLRDGRLLQVGAPAELYGAPVNPWAAAFLGPAIILDATVRNGLAETALGHLSLSPVGAAREGSAQVLLRPEQIEIRSALTGGHPAPRLTSVRVVGAIAEVELSLPDAAPLRFRTQARPLPVPDTPVVVEVLGAVHRFD